MRRSRGSSIRDTALWVVLVLALPALLRAADDEKSWGDYNGSCPAVRVSFKMDGSGISQVRLNDLRREKAELGEYGRFGSVGLYTFKVEETSSTRVVDFAVLFDEEEAVRGVTGFYTEWGPYRREGAKADDARVKAACTLDMRFSPAKRD